MTVEMREVSWSLPVEPKKVNVVYTWQDPNQRENDSVVLVWTHRTPTVWWETIIPQTRLRVEHTWRHLLENNHKVFRVDPRTLSEFER